MKLTAALFSCVSTFALAQTSNVSQPPQVPHKMEFAGITLTIRDDARREIQKDVDLLAKSPKYMNAKVERARTYFPIIEKVFEEERVPNDFKYLVLQESALISDAVSVSNAVGFWQFKDFTAIEMGLRVDSEIDERMNIVSSSRAAAKYFKKNNYYFNNWLYALQAYQMGAGGVLQTITDTESGTKHMEITSKTYWYVKKFLAHKVAYEEAVKGQGAIKIVTLVNSNRKSISEIASEFAVPESDLIAYNKWVRSEYIPGDRAYSVAIPTAGDSRSLSEAIAKASSTVSEPVARVDAKPATAKNELIHLNGIAAMKARNGESIIGFVKRSEIDLSYFLKCNDLSISDKLVAGEFYYLKKKKAKAATAHHIVQRGENLWTISQKYGVQLHKLYKYNRVESIKVEAGMIVFLSEKKSSSAISRVNDVAEVDAENTFSWAIEPETITTSAQSTPAVFVMTDVQNEVSSAVQNSSAQTVNVESKIHTVQAGETLYSIAKQYQVAVMDLVKWNNLKLEEGIKPGQGLAIQPPSPEKAQESTPDQLIHQVRPSDTLYSVARQYGVTIKEIMDWNQKNDFSITEGENLKILKKQ